MRAEATTCPKCSAWNTKKNGITGNGKQRYRCRHCGRQFIIRYSQQGRDPTDSGSLGGEQLQTLAKSARMSVLQNNSQAAGLTEIKYGEQGRQFSGQFMNLGVALTSPNTNFISNQKGTMEMVVSARGIQRRSRATPASR